MEHTEHIGIIGAGLAGLTAAYRLGQQGKRVTILEKDERVGGLAQTISVEGIPLEIYYHHAFSSDVVLWDLCKELGIFDRVRWITAPMGYLSDGKIYQFGTLLSLLKFKPLGWIDKIRFGLSTLQLMQQKNAKALEHYTADEWMKRYAGGKVYETIWKPLLVQKFGKNYDKIAITFISRKVQQRSETRKYGHEERLAYMEGSFGLLNSTLVRKIHEQGGEIRLSTTVVNLQKAETGFLAETDQGTQSFDKIIATVAPGALKQLHNFSKDFNKQLVSLEHAAVVCVVLVMNASVSDIYWLNVGDNSFPFGAVIEHTNFWGPEHYHEKRILYLSKYLSPDDPLYTMSDNDILELFLKHVQRINPTIDPKKHVLDTHVFRSRYAQPVMTVNYSTIKPSLTTPVDGLYWVSTSHIYPEDRGMNYSIKLGNDVSKLV